MYILWMEIRQLRHFCAVVDEGTFTAAAARLLVSQPGLSVSIRALEKELGSELFIRGRKRAEITEAGRRLYAGARRALTALDTVAADVRQSAGVVKSTLRIGSIPSFAGLDLAALISRFTVENPDVNVEVDVGLPQYLFGKVIDESVELAFVTMPLQQPENLKLTPLSTYPMVLATSLGHRLAERHIIELEDLAGETFVDFSPELAARQTTDEAFNAANVTRVVRVTCNEIGSLLELVAHGLGIAIVPRPLAIATRVPIALAPLSNVSLVWTIAAATRMSGVHTDAGRALWNLVAQTAKPLPSA
jgi:DNA-binding transcriptional LysR family regulator